MAKKRNWLDVLANLRIDRSKGPAPHKPLLLLLVLEMMENGEIDGNTLQLTISRSGLTLDTLPGIGNGNSKPRER